MINVSPFITDYYLDPNSIFHDELVKNGISNEEFSKTTEEFENLINSFLTNMENSGYSHHIDCGQIYFEKGKFQFMLTYFI